MLAVGGVGEISQLIQADHRAERATAGLIGLGECLRAVGWSAEGISQKGKAQGVLGFPAEEIIGQREIGGDAGAVGIGSGGIWRGVVVSGDENGAGGFVAAGNLDKEIHECGVRFRKGLGFHAHEADVVHAERSLDEGNRGLGGIRIRGGPGSDVPGHPVDVELQIELGDRFAGGRIHRCLAGGFGVLEMPEDRSSPNQKQTDGQAQHEHFDEAGLVHGGGEDRTISITGNTRP